MRGLSKGMVALAMFVMLFYGGIAEAGPYQKQIPANWQVQAAVQEPEDPMLLEAVAYEIRGTQLEGQKVRYTYSRFNLDTDAVREVLVLFQSPYYCGSGGCTAILYKPSGDGYRPISRFTLVNTPIAVSRQITNGWHDLLVAVKGGGVEAGFVRLAFDGEGYPSNPTLQPPMEAGTPATVILDDASPMYEIIVP